MHPLVPIFAALALLSQSILAANIRQMKNHKTKDFSQKALLAAIGNNFDSNIIQKQRSGPLGVVAITLAPNRTYDYSPGSVLPLSCEGIGSPAPVVRWFRNDRPIYEHDQESNEVLDPSPTSLARVVSTLLVKQAGPRDEYSCVVVAGGRTVRATTTVYRKEGAEIPLRTRLLPLAPAVLVSYKVYMEQLGAALALPCKSRGHPAPDVSWSDNSGRRIEDGERMRVLKSGELILKDLRWSDMGEFTCTASNAHGAVSATTFLYPTKVG